MASNPRLKDMTGQRFGLWTVVSKAGNAPGGAAIWNAICDCGNVGLPIGADLRSGKSTSCGCLQRAAARKTRLTHGETGTRLHRIWKGMRARCNIKTSSSYDRYGARGITICPEWEDFDAFHKWALSSGYKDGLSIDRINNDLGYSPDNCRWATAETQSQNRKFVLRRDDGVPWAAVAKANGIKVTLMHGRLHEGWPIEKAATLPKGSRLSHS